MEQVSIAACFCVKCSSRCLMPRTIRILWNDSKYMMLMPHLLEFYRRVTVLFLPTLTVCCLAWYRNLYRVRAFLLVSLFRIIGYD
jgi:hypothetical protein